MNLEMLDRIEQLERRTRELTEQTISLENDNKSLQNENVTLRTKNQALLLKVQGLLQKIFGRRSEKLGENPDQLLLFANELFAEAKAELEAELLRDDPESEEPRRPSRKNGRAPLPKDLPRERIEYHPEPEERICGCCQQEMQRIGEEITEELDYIPASVFVREHARVKYACPRCQEGVSKGQLPARPIEKGRPGPGLLSYLAVSKYDQHLPLYRLQDTFARYGVELTRSTLSDWVGWVAELVTPIVTEVKRQIFVAPLIQSDDTSVNYKLGPKSPTFKGYLWIYGIPWGEVVYDFTTNRSRDGPTNFLADYEGYLQVDAYGGYNEICRSGKVVRIGCMAHARRRFYEAKGDSPDEVAVVLSAIQKLYRLERQAKTSRLDPASTVAMRKERALPILDALKDLLEEYRKSALPESNFGNAIQYMLEEWDTITRYVEVGESEIDNNSSEHAMRHVVIGRKNYLHFGGIKGGHRAAAIYSLIVSCKRLRIDPYHYLGDVISRVATHPMSRIDELTPRGWKEALLSAGKPLPHLPDKRSENN